MSTPLRIAPSRAPLVGADKSTIGGEVNLETIGAKYDGGKVMYELLPAEALHEIARVLTFGAKKYSARNWENGINYSRIFGALMRHLWAWWSGKNTDDETGISHLAHAGCCLFFLLAYEQRKMTKFDDRPKVEANAQI